MWEKILEGGPGRRVPVGEHQATRGQFKGTVCLLGDTEGVTGGVEGKGV